jgi:ribosomal protein L11 methyltransferase
MQYIQVSFQFNTIEEYQKDLLIDELGSIGYTTFEDVTGGFAAFINLDSFNEEQLNAITTELDPDLGCRTTVAEIAAENWNEEWEKNFELCKSNFSPAEARIPV